MPILRGDDDGALLRVLLGVIAADEVDADEGITTVATAYYRLTGRQLVEEDVTRGRDHARANPSAWLDAARSLANELDAAGKAQLFTAAFEVAVADGFVLDEEDRLLSTLAAALGMTEHEYRLSVEKLLPR
jgi:uncharacterized tellurite resistance protein B-like protein